MKKVPRYVRGPKYKVHFDKIMMPNIGGKNSMAAHSVPVMSRQKVKDVIRFSVENSQDIKLPVMVWGWHGVGKTQLVKDVAKEMDYNLVILHLATQDIIDLIGRPVDVERKDPTTGEVVNVQEWCVPSWLQNSKEKSKENGKPTIFFLDEFNRGPRIVLNAMLPFLIEGLMHTHRVGPNDAIVAAANPPSDDYEVNELEDKAQLDRLGHVVMKTTVSEYIKYLKTTKMDDATIKVISGNKNLVEVPKIDPGVELKPSMRSVDYVMRKVGKKSKAWVDKYAEPVIHAYLGETFKDLWIAERSKYNNTITMDMLMNYGDNEEEITKALTSVIDDIESTNVSALEKLTENVISHFEESNGLVADDCDWFIPFLKNKMMLEEQVKKIFHQPVVQTSLTNPEVNAAFDEFVESSKTFNNSGVELW